jgi:hypothetical protein
MAADLLLLTPGAPDNLLLADGASNLLLTTSSDVEPPADPGPAHGTYGGGRPRPERVRIVDRVHLRLTVTDRVLGTVTAAAIAATAEIRVEAAAAAPPARTTRRTAYRDRFCGRTGHQTQMIRVETVAWHVPTLDETAWRLVRRREEEAFLLGMEAGRLTR